MLSKNTGSNMAEYRGFLPPRSDRPASQVIDSEMSEAEEWQVELAPIVVAAAVAAAAGLALAARYLRKA